MTRDDDNRRERLTRRRLLQRIFVGGGAAALVAARPNWLASAARSASPTATADATRAIAAATDRFVAALAADQRSLAVFAFDADSREDWHFIPKPRKGLPYKQMDAAQKRLADAVLAASLSPQGIHKMETVRSLEPILFEIEQGHGPVRDSDLYYLSVFGEPKGSDSWGLSIEGHHFSMNFTMAPGLALSSTPSFIGCNPAEVRHGPHTGLRTLPAEEDMARAFMASLDDDARGRAIVDANAPADIVSSNARKAAPLSPVGVQASKLSGAQRTMLMRLLEEYAGNVAAPIAATRMRKVHAAGLENIHFAWAGGLERGKPHYYRIQAPAFLIEYDNTQNDANHIHTVWRDFEDDFGHDILAQHYEHDHHQ